MSGPIANQPGSTWSRPGPPSGPSLMSPGRLIVAFGAVFLVIVVLAAIAIVVLGPQKPPPECQPGQVCGGPPASPPPVTGEVTPAPTGTAAPAPTTPSATPSAVPAATPTATPAPTAAPGSPVPTEPVPTGAVEPTTPPSPLPTAGALPQPVEGDPDSPPLRTWPTYVDSAWGYTLHHPPFVAPQQLDDGGVAFNAGNVDYDIEVAVRVDARRATVSPEQLRDELVDGFGGRISSLAIDDDPLTRVHRPSIGHVPAVVASYRGDLGTSGSLSPVALVVMSATDGQMTVAVSVVVINPDTVLPGTSLRWFRVSGQVVDPVLKRFEWPAP